jgi:predicted amidohydrolase
LRAFAVQMDIAWEDPQANCARAKAMIADAGVAPGDLVVLPEMFATGYSMDVPHVAEEPRSGGIQRFLSTIAEDTEAYVLGGVAVRAGAARARNEAHLFAPDGRRALRYAKMHPFGYAGETEHYAPGERLAVEPVGPVRLAPLVCYDLRFPEAFRQAVRCGADAFAVIANWPAAREAHWRHLLTARAIENQAFVIGCNRAGADPNVTYDGGSRIIAPDGRLLAEAGADAEVISAELDVHALHRLRETFPVLRDMRDDLLGG